MSAYSQLSQHTLAILHGRSQSLLVVQCEKRLEKVACVCVAVVAGKDEAGNTVKSVAGVSMNERDDRGLHSAFSISWREGRGRYLRSQLVLPLPAPPPLPNHQVSCLINTGAVRVSWKGKQVDIIGVHFKENATQKKALLIHLFIMRYFLESFITYSTKTFSQLFS